MAVRKIAMIKIEIMKPIFVVGEKVFISYEGKPRLVGNVWDSIDPKYTETVQDALDNGYDVNFLLTESGLCGFERVDIRPLR
jgi:hypothetical protein